MAWRGCLRYKLLFFLTLIFLPTASSLRCFFEAEDAEVSTRPTSRLLSDNLPISNDFDTTQRRPSTPMPFLVANNAGVLKTKKHLNPTAVYAKNQETHTESSGSTTSKLFQKALTDADYKDFLKEFVWQRFSNFALKVLHTFYAPLAKSISWFFKNHND